MQYFYLPSKESMCLFLKQTLKFFTQKCYEQSFVEFGKMILKKKKRKNKSLEMEIETNSGQIVIKKAHFCSIFNSDTNFKKIII